MRFTLFILLLASLLYAQNDSLIMVKKSDLPATLVKQLEVKNQIETNVEMAGKFAGVGREVGVAVREGLSALNEESNKFADTKVGTFVMFIIAFKVMGYVVIQFIIGVPLIIIGTFVFIFYFMRNCVDKKVLVSEEIGEDKKKIKKYENQHPEETYLPLCASGIYAAYLLFCVAIIFLH